MQFTPQSNKNHEKHGPGWSALHGLALPHHSAGRTHPALSQSNTPQCPQYPSLEPSSDLSKYLMQCHALPLLHAGKDDVGVPATGEEEELLSPTPVLKAHRTRAGFHPRADPCAAGPGAGTVPITAGFKGEGRGKESQQHPSPGFLGSTMLCEQQLGEGVTPGAGNAGPDPAATQHEEATSCFPRALLSCPVPPPPAGSTQP